MARRRKPPEPVQDPLDLGVTFTEIQPRASKTKVPAGGYLRQEKLANPPLCLRCIDAYNNGTRKRAPNRISHRAWIPSWTMPELMCVEHAMDFGTEHNLGRSKSRK